MKKILQFCSDESGATAIEYGLIAGLMAAAIITILNNYKDDMSTTFTNIGKTMTGNSKPVTSK